MQLRTVAFSIFTDQQGTRIRCCFCGEVLETIAPTFTLKHHHDVNNPILDHRCYQPDAQPPCPSVKA